VPVLVEPPRRNPAIWGLVAAIALVVVVAVTIVTTRLSQPTVVVMPKDPPAAGAPAGPPQVAPVVARPAADAGPAQPFPAVLEATGVVTVQIDTSGTVTRLPNEGTAIAVGDVLVEIRRPSPEADQKLKALKDLEAKYGDSPDHADFIAQAREEYARARAKRVRVTFKSPVAGTIVRLVAREGQRLAEGDPVVQVAEGGRLIVDVGAVEGSGTRCAATLVADGRALAGTIEPARPGGNTRVLALDAYPAGLLPGAVGDARVRCAP
jgi:multidrug efflux pump subunit AcrA (membrane-fusion protein)